MKKQILSQSNSHLTLYVLIVALIAGICAVILPSISIPTEHISQNIEVKLDK